MDKGLGNKKQPSFAYFKLSRPFNSITIQWRAGDGFTLDGLRFILVGQNQTVAEEGFEREEENGWDSKKTYDYQEKYVVEKETLRSFALEEEEEKAKEEDEEAEAVIEEVKADQGFCLPFSSL